MAQQSLWRRFLDAVEQTYERRIRAASLVKEYGAHHEADHTDDGGEEAVIANVPRGTRLRPLSGPDQPS
jgi:hypothetical protein